MGGVGRNQRRMARLLRDLGHGKTSRNWKNLSGRPISTLFLDFSMERPEMAQIFLFLFLNTLVYWVTCTDEPHIQDMRYQCYEEAGGGGGIGGDLSRLIGCISEHR